jgi:hypothetical protein
VLDSRIVAYLDFGGSRAETSADLPLLPLNAATGEAERRPPRQMCARRAGIIREG